MKKIEVLGLQTIPEITQGDNLAEIVVNCAANEIGGLQDKDIIVLTSKIVSKALKATMRATAYARGLKQRLFLRIDSWFI